MTQLCRWMRWKGFYGPTSFSDEDLTEHFENNEVPYSCLRTAAPWGPDDTLCAPESCVAGRTCFEASMKRKGAPLS